MQRRPSRFESQVLPPITLCSLLWAFGTAPGARADDWTNSGGNSGRNGLSTAAGPSAPTLRWSGSRSSLISWLPVTDATSVYTVRQPKWPDQQPNDAYVVAQDLATGTEQWATVLPYQAGDWIPWVGGVNGGRVYASRSGNGASISARLVALDAANGSILWQTAILQDMGSYDGMVFAPDGDPIVASFEDIWRFNAEDGALVWHAARVGSVSGTCGGAIFGNALYVADAVPGGHALVRYDLTTGTRLYQSPTMPGFTIQNTPMVGPDGTVYLNRAQNNAAVDFYYAFTDTGSQFVQKWQVGGMAGANAELGIGPDGSVYAITSGPRISRLDPDDGSVLNQSAVLAGFSSARFAIDRNGRVFFSNGAFASGRLYSYEADLTPRWNVAVPNINIGGPTLAADGTLIVCGTGTDLRAFFTPTVDAPELALSVAAAGLRAVPNPFARETAIHFVLPGEERASIEVFDAQGARVRRLSDSRDFSAGEHLLTWDGASDDGRPLASGVYYVVLRAGRWSETTRALLVR
ncbi:MAG: PQQ-binding-like beta-propeller repeat protein [Candidatus Eisenbacteria bacterium]|nr:PQQ-binding-like beta-propeller repeat protein [Candidatus Eisenbacteria bacterium]MCC7140521.1 PQQ-binding-like beta-propeller repeat protein [Candidatus Eisenbacteria bacterium]